MRRQSFLGAMLSVSLLGALSSADAQGRIFVNNDEWALSSTGIANAGAANVTNFTRNVAAWLTGATTSRSILLATSNFGFPQATMSADLNSGGYAISATLNNTVWANRNSYNAVYVDATTASGGTNAQFQADLQAYVLGGRSVYINLGTGVGGPAEASVFNTFLGYFGIQANAATYNGVSGNINTSTYAAQAPFGSVLFTGVSTLYQDNGNALSLGGPNTANGTRQIFSIAGGAGLFAAVSTTSVVPEPSTWALMAAGLMALGVAARRRRA